MKKIILTVSLALSLLFALAVFVGAEDTVSVHDGRVNLYATVTLDDGTVCELFDSEGNALIWFTVENSYGGFDYGCIRADDPRVKYKATYRFKPGNETVGTIDAFEVSQMWIDLDSSTRISSKSIVVLNLMDDDVLVNEASSPSYLNGPVNCIKNIMQDNPVLEYAYLRLDTAAIQANAFLNCSKLKYVNLKSLTELRQIGGSRAFAGCVSLFKGELLNLMDTKLIRIGDSGAFNAVPFADLRLPSTVLSIDTWSFQGTGLESFVVPPSVTSISSYLFKDCKNLTTVYLNSAVTSIENYAFQRTSLEKIFFAGTLEQLESLLFNTDANNSELWAVVGENRENLISYKDYAALEDKSGKYVIYDYSYCRMYFGGAHIEGEKINECQYICDRCKYILTYKFTLHYTESSVSVYDDSSLTVNKFCGVCYAALGAEDFAPMFVSKGYSLKTFGNTASLVQGYLINSQSVNAYVVNSGESICAIACINSGDEMITPNPDDRGVSLICPEILEKTALDIRVSGLTEDDYDTSLVFCIYVDGRYFDNGSMKSEIKGVSYNYILNNYNN